MPKGSICADPKSASGSDEAEAVSPDTNPESESSLEVTIGVSRMLLATTAKAKSPVVQDKVAGDMDVADVESAPDRSDDVSEQIGHHASSKADAPSVVPVELTETNAERVERLLAF